MNKIDSVSNVIYILSDFSIKVLYFIKEMS